MKDHKFTHLPAVVQPAKLLAHGETNYKVTLATMTISPHFQVVLEMPHTLLHMLHVSHSIHIFLAICGGSSYNMLHTVGLTSRHLPSTPIAHKSKSKMAARCCFLLRILDPFYF